MQTARNCLFIACFWAVGLMGAFGLASAQTPTDLVVGPLTFPSGASSKSGLSTLTTSGAVTIPSASQVVFKAGTLITLSEGFNVQAGGTFTASIEVVVPDPNPTLNVVPTNKPAAYPNWWFEGGVIPRSLAGAANFTPTWPVDYATTDDFAAVNQGQVKNIAVQAVRAMDKTLPGGAGTPLSTLVAGWGAPGLRGEYFANMDLTGLPVLIRNEAVDFDWLTGSPAPSLPSDQFSVRWTGELIPTVSGTYKFETVSDDGVRLWVNDQPNIDNWTDHGPTTDQSAPVDLVSGSRYPIKLEFYEKGGGATIRLRWIPPGATVSSAIPDSVLKSNNASSTDDYRAINLGQLKAVAEPFYARLQALGYAGQPLAAGQTRPWTGTGADDYALANIGQVKNVFSFDPLLVDLVAPTTPVGLASSILTPTGFTLNWSASTDNASVAGYDVYLDGVKVTTSLTTSFTFTNLADVTTYSMFIKARDAAGNVSGSSSTVQVATSAYAIKDQVFVGASHSLALKRDGTVWAWGKNDYGQLGQGNAGGEMWSPSKINSLVGVTALAVGQSHSLALKSDGTVWTWGYNNYGQLGDGTTTLKSTPLMVPGLTGVFVAIAAGQNHSLAVKSDGTVWAWGYNYYGQVGTGVTTPNQYTTPQQVLNLASGVSRVAAGDFTSYALKADGTVWAWGYNGYGQFGNNLSPNSATPVQSTSFTGVYTAIAAGRYHLVALKSDGSVWSCGFGSYGQIGDGNYSNRSVATKASLPVGSYISIASGLDNSAALRSDGNFYTWGGNSFGQIGNSSTGSGVNLPFAVTSPTGVKAIAVGQSTYAVDSQGSLYSWGNNQAGQLGRSTNVNQSTPGLVPAFTFASQLALPTLTPDGGCYLTAPTVQVATSELAATLRYTLDGNDPSESSVLIASGSALVPAQVILKLKAFKSGRVASETKTAAYIIGHKVVVGDSHTLALKVDGTVWAWGKNDYGQLGQGNTGTGRLMPTKINSLSGIKALAAGQSHSLALNSEGKVFAWGNNQYGKLGTGDTINKSTPLEVPGLTGVIAIAAGQNHSLAVKADGTVWAWGYNGYGQVGTGVTTPSQYPTPQQVLNLASGVIAVAVGDYTSYALKADGTVWAWGNNSYGQFGSNSYTASSTPIKTGTLAGVIAIAAGSNHLTALKSDGSVWSWGSGGTGQMGDGFSNNRSVATKAALPVGTYTSIAAGKNSSAAVKSDGTLYTWGENSYGAFGSGSKASTISTPIIVTGLGRVMTAAIGQHAIVVNSANSVYGIGRNSDGQVGDNTKIDRWLPVYIGNDAAGGGFAVGQDTDGDGLSDAAEAALGTNSLNVDSDGDGMPDGWDYLHGFNPLVNDSLLDWDGDGANNLTEYTAGSDPQKKDSDGDGMEDGYEITNGLDSALNDALEDKDGDLVPNLWEAKRGTLANNASSKPASTFVVAASGGNHTTIQAAINAVPAGTAAAPAYAVIEVRQGVYPEYVQITNTGVRLALVAKPTVPTAAVEINGGTAYNHNVVYVTQPAVISGFTVSRLINASQLATNHNTGINISLSDTTSRALISNCVIRGQRSSSAGALMISNADVTLQQVTMYDNLAAVASYYGNAAYISNGKLQIRNSIIWGQSGGASNTIYRNGSNATVTSSGSIIYAGEYGGQNVDPLINPQGFLRVNSPAINLGLAANGTCVDIYGNLRTNLPDAGAIEFIDSDSDLLPDTWELQNAPNLTSLSGLGGIDTDADGMSDLIEMQKGTTPLSYNGVSSIVVTQSVDASSANKNATISFYAYKAQAVTLKFYKFYYESVATGDGFGASRFDLIDTRTIQAVAGNNTYQWDGILTGATPGFHDADVVALEVISLGGPSPVSEGGPGTFTAIATPIVSSDTFYSDALGRKPYENTLAQANYSVTQPSIVTTPSSPSIMPLLPVLPGANKVVKAVSILESGAIGQTNGYAYAKSMPINSIVYLNNRPDVSDFTVQAFRTVPSNGEVVHARFNLNKATKVSLLLADPSLIQSSVYARMSDGSYQLATDLSLPAGLNDIEFRVLNYSGGVNTPTHFTYDKVVKAAEAGRFRVRIQWEMDLRTQSGSVQRSKAIRWAYVNVE